MRPSPIEIWLDEQPAEARSTCLRGMRLLATDVLAKKVQFLVGAGMSKASRVALGPELAARMTAELLEGLSRLSKPIPDYLLKIVSIFPLEAIAEAYESATDKPRLAELIEAETASGSPHPGHTVLKYFVNNGFIDRVYTTNFDRIIEKELDKGETVTDENALKMDTLLRNGYTPVLHLHGAIGFKCRISESDTYELPTPIARLMAADMVTRRFVWVGYSLSDVDLRTLYLSTRDLLRETGSDRRPYVVHPLRAEKPEERPELEWQLASQVWSARHATFIPGTAEKFLPALKVQVQRANAEELAGQVVAARGGDPKNTAELEQLWNDAAALALETGLGDEVEALEVLANRHGVRKAAR